MRPSKKSYFYTYNYQLFIQITICNDINEIENLVVI